MKRIRPLLRLLMRVLGGLKCISPLVHLLMRVLGGLKHKSSSTLVKGVLGGLKLIMVPEGLCVSGPLVPSLTRA